MKKLLLLMLVFVLFSCKKDEKATSTSIKQDSAALKKNSTSEGKSAPTLETFNFPEEVQGCSCYFAKDKADFEAQKYIYVDDYGNNATVKIGGKKIKFPMQEGDFDPSNFGKTLNNGEYKLKMTGKKTNDSEEAMMFQGEITVENKNGETTTSTIYGECGC